MKGNLLLMSLKFALGVVAFFVVLAWAIMQMWNGVVPRITGWSTLNYPDALVLLVLVRLFVGLKVSGGGYLKRQFGNKWSKLSEDERLEMRAKFKSKWCDKE